MSEGTAVSVFRTDRFIQDVSGGIVNMTLREERRLGVFENRVLRRIFGPKRDEVTGDGESFIMRSFKICTPHPILCG
jgi:hypothetical protein